MSNPLLDQESINTIFDRYEKMKLLEKLGGVVEDRYFRNPLDEEDKKLSILTKKKMLGLPIDSEDYEDATNTGESFYSQVAPSLAKHGIQAIPGPSFMSGAKHPPVEPIYQVASFVEDLLPSVRKSSTKIAKGSYYGAGKLPRLASIFLHKL